FPTRVPRIARGAARSHCGVLHADTYLPRRERRTSPRSGAPGGISCMQGFQSDLRFPHTERRRESRFRGLEIAQTGAEAMRAMADVQARSETPSRVEFGLPPAVGVGLPSAARSRLGRTLWPYWTLLRVDHWSKNAFMVLGIILALFYRPGVF